MKIRITKDTSIYSVLDKIDFLLGNSDEKRVIINYINELILQENEFSELKVRKYFISKSFILNGKNITIYIRSDNLWDKIKKVLNRNG